MTAPAFLNPCRLCGAEDEHAERLKGARAAVAAGLPVATVCPHPEQPGHGTGCTCGAHPRLLMPSLAGKQLVPFDLHAPTQLLTPGRAHKRTGWRKAEVSFGVADDATLTVTSWTGCEVRCPGPGEHRAGQSAWLSVPCENMPHCGSCECGDHHSVTITADQLAALKAALG